MFDERKFINTVLNVDINRENESVDIPELINSLGFDVNYKSSKKRGRIVGKGFKCRNENGAIKLNGKKEKVVVNLLINKNAFHGIIKSSKGTIVVRTDFNAIIAQYYDKKTTKIAEQLKLVGKYGIDDTYGIGPDDIATIENTAQLGELVKILKPKKLAKNRKK